MPNRLAACTSPYLLQHAEQPVDWRPWGEEAFAEAAALDRPIFLSAGYSTCHWCHVMAHESFDDPEIAEVMNRSFINVKLDREERPDIDRIYLQFLQATTGQGGWPMSVWMTPDRRPFYAGTYFPPAARHGRPGFIELCRAVASAWHNDRVRLTNQADALLDSLRQRADRSASAETPQPSPEATLACAEEVCTHHDPENGGFGSAPKFPRPATLVLLQQAAQRGAVDRDSAAAAQAVLNHTLQAFVRGGIHDAVGGGFHRYTVDPRWHVPHFEKMLYDQGQIACLLAEASKAPGGRGFRRPLRRLCSYLLRDLRGNHGAFFAAEDADSPLPGNPTHTGEGAFYLWAAEELEQVLGDSYPFFCDAYRIGESGNVDPAYDPHGEFRGANILERHISDAALMERHGLDERRLDERHDAVLARLRKARDGRPRPHRDEKVVAAWNGLALSGLARASQALGDASLAAAAEAAAAFLKANLWDPQRRVLHRSWLGKPGPDGFAEDYLCLATSLLDLYETNFDTAHLAWAITLAELAIERFSGADGAFYGSAEGSTDTVLRLADDHDGAEPSATSTAALLLARLAHLTGRSDFATRARACLSAFGGAWRSQPMSLPALAAAADFIAGPVQRILLSGSPEHHDLRQLVRTVHTAPGLRRVLLLDDRGAGRERLAELGIDLGPAPASPTQQAIVCSDSTCSAPTTSPVRLLELLRAG